MKRAYEQKVEIYRERKEDYYTWSMLSKKWEICIRNLEYMVRLIDRHGIESVKHTWTEFSNEYKKEAIDCVLIGGETITEVSIRLGLSNTGTLARWIKEYKANGYNVIKRKKGRKAHAGKEEKIIGRAGEGECGASPEELEAYHRERIRKKIKCLSSGKRRPRKQEIAQAITELRQELKCSLRFILETIQMNPDLPQITRSDYYYWSSNHIDSDEKNDDVMNEIIHIYYANKGRYGYRRITLQLHREGFYTNHKMVHRLLQRMELQGITPKAKYKSYKGDLNGTVKSQLLNKVVDEENHKTYYKRNFSTAAVNEKWTTDVSEFHIADGKLYLSPILDMKNSEIVSYSISESPNYAQTQEMLDQAFEKYPDLTGLILHSDQGWQYQMVQYHKALMDKGIIQSMSRKGNCLDNCVMENFFGKMKNEMFYGHEFEFKTLNDLKEAMDEYILYYNTERIQVKLKGLTPCEYRNQALLLSH
jgi:transposase InsO family protein/transposase-like protein